MLFSLIKFQTFIYIFQIFSRRIKIVFNLSITTFNTKSSNIVKIKAFIYLNLYNFLFPVFKLDINKIFQKNRDKFLSKAF